MPTPLIRCTVRRAKRGPLACGVKVMSWLTLMPGVVSVPHGWGHDRDGVGWRVAADHPGASVNDVTDSRAVDPLSGNAVLNGIPVALAPL